MSTDETDGAAILTEVERFIDRYTAFPNEHCRTVLTLWAAHTHTPDAFYVTPRLILDSPEPGSGKTRVLEVLNLVSYRPKLTISATVAAIFRRLADGPITILFDEVDAIFHAKNAASYEDLRALLNAGYKRGATIDRCVGDASSMQVQEFVVFAPVALAGIAGHMPATITTRAIVIHMRKRGPEEQVDSFRERDAEETAAPIRQALTDWMNGQKDTVSRARPSMPEGVVDRPAEVWEALLAIADSAGGDWPERARNACRHFVLDSEPEAQSLGVRLLADLRTVFEGGDRLHTPVILERLHALDEAPWGDLYGKPLDARRLARELAKYGITPTTVRVNGTNGKGYTTTPSDDSVGLDDAWKRYLSPPPPQSRNSRNIRNIPAQNVTATEVVTDRSVTSHQSVTGVTSNVTEVTDVTAHAGDSPKQPCIQCGDSFWSAESTTRCYNCRHPQVSSALAG